jgi:hypothetical protein
MMLQAQFLKKAVVLRDYWRRRGRRCRIVVLESQFLKNALVLWNKRRRRGRRDHGRMLMCEANSFQEPFVL